MDFLSSHINSRHYFHLDFKQTMSISLNCLSIQNCAGLGNSTLLDQLAHAHTLTLKLEFQVLPLLLGNMICFLRCNILIRFFGGCIFSQNFCAVSTDGLGLAKFF